MVKFNVHWRSVKARNVNHGLVGPFGHQNPDQDKDGLGRFLGRVPFSQSYCSRQIGGKACSAISHAITVWREGGRKENVGSRRKNCKWTAEEKGGGRAGGWGGGGKERKRNGEGGGKQSLPSS